MPSADNVIGDVCPARSVLLADPFAVAVPEMAVEAGLAARQEKPATRGLAERGNCMPI
jgi:hypothetical protein